MKNRIKSQKMLLGALFFIMIAVIFVLKARFSSMQISQNQLEREQFSQNGLPHALTQGWKNIDELLAHPSAFASVKAVKALFEVHLTEEGRDVVKILVSRKNVSKKRKSFGKWEFPGGRVDDGESVLSSLQRELQEEDPSLILLKSLNEIPKGLLVFKQVFLSQTSSQIIVKLPLDQKSWQDLLAAFTAAPLGAKSESLGYYLIDPKYLDLDDSVRKQWTPKSRKILAAMKQ